MNIFIISLVYFLVPIPIILIIAFLRGRGNIKYNREEIFELSLLLPIWPLIALIYFVYIFIIYPMKILYDFGEQEGIKSKKRKIKKG